MQKASQRLRIVLIWDVLIAAALGGLFPWLLVGRPLWSLTGENGWIILGFVLWYIVIGGVSYFRLVRVQSDKGHERGWVVALLGLVIMFLAILIFAGPDYSRKVLLGGTALYLGGVVGRMVLLSSGSYLLLSAGIGTIAVAAVAGAVLIPRPLPEKGPEMRNEIISASQHTLEVSYYSAYVPGDSGFRNSGGAVTHLPGSSDYLLVTANGTFFRFGWSDSDDLMVQKLNGQVPINSDEFSADVAKDVVREGFRVADILARREGDSIVIYVAHHYWKHEDRCFVVRVSQMVLVDTDDGTGRRPTVSSGRPIFESEPCLPIEESRGAAFAGVQLGGNIETMPDGKLIMTIGDHQFDGWYHSRDLVSDMNSHYGKTVLIDPESGAAEIFTVGHRNPQGLAVDGKARIWSTEHGPQGGDELNLLRAGRHYGYPFHTYGTEYGAVTWPLQNEAKLKDGHEKPVLAWVPSIGVSELIAVTDPAFERWQGDLLVSSLRGRQLWRVRLEGERAVYAEPIRIGERIRDITGRGDGQYVLWTDSEKIVRIRPMAELDDGASLFTVQCGGCHDDKENRIGPTLNGLMGRDIASKEGYIYSPALQKFEGRWSDKSLDAFIANPQAFAPGNKMAIDGVHDAESRRKIIKYIKDQY